MHQSLPTDLKTVRVLLFIFAGLSLVGAAGTLISWGSSLTMVVATFVLLGIPGAIAFLFGALLPRGGPVMFWLLIVMCAFWVLAALSNVSSGLSWIIQILWPGLVLYFLLRRRSKDFFFSR